MLNPDKLSIVESLTFNALLWKSREYGTAHKLGLLGDIYHLSNDGFNKARYTDGYGDILTKYCSYCHTLMDNEAWTFRTAHNNACNKLAYPKVKLPVYTLESAVAEAKETIEWIKERYKESR